MSAGERHWTVRVTAAAEGDFQEIVRWTLAYFGEDQARVYGETLSDALQALTSGQSVAGARQRDDIAKGLLTLHVRRQGRKGRHIILFRVGPDQDHEAIEVLRILHDAMDLQRHIPT